MLYVFSNKIETIAKIKKTGLTAIFSNPKWVIEADFKNITSNDKIGIDETSKENELVKVFIKKTGATIEDYSSKTEEKKLDKKSK